MLVKLIAVQIMEPLVQIPVQATILLVPVPVLPNMIQTVKLLAATLLMVVQTLVELKPQIQSMATCMVII
tara:strand:- start:272 stop:481 length:210 start_codon:yes stop_codon:yes gene_type:complete